MGFGKRFVGDYCVDPTYFNQKTQEKTLQNYTPCTNDCFQSGHYNVTCDCYQYHLNDNTNRRIESQFIITTPKAIVAPKMDGTRQEEQCTERNVYSPENMQPDTGKKRSIVSLYRKFTIKNFKQSYLCYKCTCLGTIYFTDTRAQTEAITTKNKKGDTNSQFKNKHDEKIQAIEEVFAEGPQRQLNCARGLCTEENTYCLCKKNNKMVMNQRKICTDTTCRALKQQHTKRNNRKNIKNQIVCLCQKYSQDKRRANRNKIDGDAKKKHKSILCLCDKYSQLIKNAKRKRRENNICLCEETFQEKRKAQKKGIICLCPKEFQIEKDSKQSQTKASKLSQIRNSLKLSQIKRNSKLSQIKKDLEQSQIKRASQLSKIKNDLKQSQIKKDSKLSQIKNDSKQSEIYNDSKSKKLVEKDIYTSQQTDRQPKAKDENLICCCYDISDKKRKKEDVLCLCYEGMQEDEKTKRKSDRKGIVCMCPEQSVKSSLKSKNLIDKDIQVNGKSREKQKITDDTKIKTAKVEPKKFKPPKKKVETSPKLERKTCVKGRCAKALTEKNNKFVCSCEKDAKETKNECRTETCKDVLIKVASEITQTEICEQNCPKKCLIDEPKKRNITEKKQYINKFPQDVGEQTGEPFMEMTINCDDIGVSVLEPYETMKKVTELRNYNKERTCPPCKTSCSVGICGKLVKDNKNNADCTCKSAKCTEVTPNSGKNIKKTRDVSSNLLEVKLDPKTMRLVNSEAVRYKVTEIEAESKKRSKEVCPRGICKVAKARKFPYKCSCIQRKRKCEITCSDAICQSDTKSKIMIYFSEICKREKNYHRTRKDIDPALEIQNIKSKVSSINQNLAPPKANNKKQSSNRVHKRNGLELNTENEHPDTCICKKCPRPRPATVKKDLTLASKCKSAICSSVCSCMNRGKYVVNKPGKDCSCKPQQKQKENCECDEIMEYEKKRTEMLKQKRIKNKLKRKLERARRKQQLKKKKIMLKRKKEADKYNKVLTKEQRRKEKIENKEKLKQFKEEQKEMKLLAKADHARDTNCLADFFLGVIALGLRTLKAALKLLFNVIMNPEKCLDYTKARIRDPKGTIQRLSRWWSLAWQKQKFRMVKSIKGSENMSILADTVQETDFYQAFAHKGKTEEERQFIDQRTKRRKRRILQRHNAAIYGCQHMLLVTLRKTPCLWVYHICPNMYPQCLSFLSFFKNFTDMMLFCLAFLVWTPCIFGFELCRAFMCCCLCTQ